MECAIDQCCWSLNYKKNSTSLNEPSCELLHNIANYSAFVKMLEINTSYDYVYLINPEKVRESMKTEEIMLKQYSSDISPIRK